MDNKIHITFESHRSSLLSYAIKYIGNIDDAEDAVQVTLIAAMQSADKCRALQPGSNCSVLTWLIAILRNTCHNVFRSNAMNLPYNLDARKSHPLGDDADECRGYTELLESLQSQRNKDEADHAERRSQALYRLQHADLSERERECVLYRLQGMSYAEIAVEVSFSTEEGVRTALRRAMAAIRNYPVCGIVETRIKPDHLFWMCAYTYIYHAPPKLGTSLDRQKLSKMKTSDYQRFKYHKNK